MRYSLHDQETQARKEMQKIGYPSFYEMLKAIKEHGKLPREKVEQVEQYYRHKHAQKRRMRKKITAAMIVLFAFVAVACLPEGRAIAEHLWERCMSFVEGQLMVIHDHQAQSENQEATVSGDNAIEKVEETEGTLEANPAEFSSIEELQQYLDSSITALDPEFAEPVQITCRARENGRKTVTIRYETERYGEIMVKQMYDEDDRGLGISQNNYFKVEAERIGLEMMAEISEKNGWFGAYCFVDDNLFGIGIEKGEFYQEVISHLVCYEGQ